MEERAGERRCVVAFQYPKRIIRFHERHLHRPPPPSRPDGRGEGTVARFEGGSLRRLQVPPPASTWEILFWISSAQRRVCRWNWTVFSTVYPSTFSATRNGQRFWRRRTSKSYDSGIINGGRTGKACCWKSGKRCIAAQAV